MISITHKGKRRAFTAPLSAASIEARNAAGETVVTKLQDHFLKRNAQPNTKGWPTRGFWADVLKSVGTNISDTSYAITVASPPFWRRWKGGEPISPKLKKRLAIPAIAEAYVAGTPGAGRIPIDLGILVRRRAGRSPSVALAEYSERPAKDKSGRTVRVFGRVWYWLVQQANPLPGGDPDAIPPVSELNAAANVAADAYLRAVAIRARQT